MGHSENVTGSFDVSALIFDLYQGSLDDFVTRRAAAAQLAKEAGDTQTARGILTLRRPTAAAHLINHLPHEQMDAIASLGRSLRAATARMDADEMKTLDAERARLLDEVMAGIKASSSVRDEVRQTLHAALADEKAADAVASRRLTKAIRYAGFGEVDLSQVLAKADGSRRLRAVADTKYGIDLSTDIRRARRAVEKAEQAQQLAQRRHEAAAAALQAAQQAFDAATSSLEGATARVAAAKVELTGLTERAGWSKR